MVSNAKPGRIGAQGITAFRVVAPFVVTAVILLGVFQSAAWYAQEVSIPRYCGDPSGATEMVRQTLSSSELAAGAPTRAHVIAAKLLYLVPQQDGESRDIYLARLERRIMESCP